MKPVLLEAANLGFRIHKNLKLNVPRLRISSGEIVAILGPNGAGKTTFLNILTGVQSPHEGSVMLREESIFALSAMELARRRSVMRASALQDGAQGLSVREVIGLGAISNPMHPRLANVLVAALAHRFELLKLLETDFGLLSSGEKQRVHAARVFLQLYGRENGHLVFLDEPYAHLDARHTQLLARELTELKKQGAGILCVLHDINFAGQNTDRVIFLKDAEIIEEADAGKIYESELLERVYDARFAVLKSGRSRYVVAKN